MPRRREEPGASASISADTITDERCESFYRVRVRTDDNTLEKDGQVLPIIPGMTTQVDIVPLQVRVLPGTDHVMT